MLPELLSQILADQEIGSVTADGAYETRNCHNAIHCPAVHVYMPERGGPCSLCRHPAAKERSVMEAQYRWRGSQELRGIAFGIVPPRRDQKRSNPDHERGERDEKFAQYSPSCLMN